MQFLFTFLLVFYTVTTYPYTTGTPGTATSTNTYTYGNAEWGDLLTKYNGQTITYDNIGNPLTWRDGMTMTWQDGRRLAHHRQFFLRSHNPRPLTVVKLYKPMGKIYNIPTTQMD